MNFSRLVSWLRPRALSLLLFFIFGAPFEKGVLTAAAAEESTVYVQVQSTSLRTQPQHWAASAAELHYGDRLVVLSNVEAGSAGVPGWLKVKRGGQQGYVHFSAVTSRTVVLKGKTGGEQRAPSANDIVLAGKGFNADVEKEYSAKGAQVNYVEVDRMEARRISDGEVASAISTGKLGLPGGKI